MVAKTQPIVGVLALQGDFRDHARALDRSGATTRPVRLSEDLDDLDGLVIPGGESTTMEMLLERMGLWRRLHAVLSSGLPTMATCAGLILLAREILDGRTDQRGLALLDVAVRRNGYGRQVDSFEAPVYVDGFASDFPGVFIRAPILATTGTAMAVAYHAGQPVGVRQGAITAFTFHPELTGDLRIHDHFVGSLKLSPGQSTSSTGSRRVGL